jgi:Tfp pilus assembly protein PilX
MEQALFPRITESAISETGPYGAVDSMPCRRPQGFALITALIATIIILALGVLVIQLSTQDLRSSSATVGEKKALTAADTGIHQLMRDFDPQAAGGTAGFAATDVVVDATDAPGDQYSIGVPALPASGPAFIPMSGYSIGGGQTWGQKRFNVDVTGENIRYDTKVQIGIGVGYGPIEISTMSR